MKKITLVIFVFLCVFSCSRNETNSDNEDLAECKIISSKQYNYMFDDVDISNIYNPNFEKFGFEYDSQNRINKVIGSLTASLPSSGFYLSSNSFDEITYSGNTVSVKVSANMTIRPYDKEFVIENGKIISSKVYILYPFVSSVPNSYTYQYSGNQVIEKYDGTLNNRINRIFTIENGNLTKVEKLYYDSDNSVNGKKIYTFSGYDNQENLLKDKFFINGAFYMAFSKNIYHNFDSHTYLLQNGNFEPNGEYYTWTLPDSSDYFEKQCN